MLTDGNPQSRWAIFETRPDENALVFGHDMPSPESEDETRPAQEAAAAERPKSDEPAWPPAEARPPTSPPDETSKTDETSPPDETSKTDETSPPDGAAAPAELASAVPAADEPVLIKAEELPAPPGQAPRAEPKQSPAAEPTQEMGLSESTLHWLVDGEKAIEPVVNDPGTAPHYDPRAPVAGRKRTVVVIGGAAVVAFVVALVLHGQAARNRAASVPAVASAEPAAVLTRRAEAALAQGRAAEALDLANLALGSDARFSEAFIVVGRVQHSAGRVPETRDAYRKYLELAPLGTHAEEARAALATLPP
jgi:hypothetical protein